MKEQSSSSISTVAKSSSAASSKDTTSSSQAKSSSGASSTKNGKRYAEVGSGQGIYRVAVNNGLTVDQLLQMNPGLSSGSTITPGQKVRVK